MAFAAGILKKIKFNLPVHQWLLAFNSQRIRCQTLEVRQWRLTMQFTIGLREVTHFKPGRRKILAHVASVREFRYS